MSRARAPEAPRSTPPTLKQSTPPHPNPPPTQTARAREVRTRFPVSYIGVTARVVESHRTPTNLDVRRQHLDVGGRRTLSGNLPIPVLPFSLKSSSGQTGNGVRLIVTKALALVCQQEVDEFWIKILELSMGKILIKFQNTHGK